MKEDVDMRKMRLLALVLAVLMVLGLFAGCDSQGAVTPGTEPAGNGQTAATENKGQTEATAGKEETEPTAATEEEAPAEEEEKKESKGFVPLTAEKIGFLDVDYFTTTSGGLYYQNDDDLYGIMTFDGKNDTGAKYTVCRSDDKYFQVSTVDPASISLEDPTTINCVGLVDAMGKEIVPMKYAAIDVLNERYAKVIEVTEQVASKDEALVYFTEKMFSFSAGDDDILFKGVWYIYDMIAGQLLEGATGTKPYSPFAYGDYISYISDDKERITVNSKGEALPKDAEQLGNGYYVIEKDDSCVVYTDQDKKAFVYSEDTYDWLNCYEEDYIVAAKYDEVKSYVILDLKGNVVSAVFSDLPSVYGELLCVEGQVFDFQGNPVIEGTFDRIDYDDDFGKAWFLEQENMHTWIAADGTVLYQGTEDDDTRVDAWGISKKIDDNRMYYSFAEKDFVLDGNSFAPWMVEVNTGGVIYDIVDTISGQAIISGYEDYDYAEVSDFTFYVYAENEEGGHDIYIVQ